MLKHRILYLEDDEALGALTAGVLRREGFEVTWAKDGEEGLALFNSHPPDLCIVDIMLPKLDGYSLVTAIRKTGHVAPVIFLSARVLTEDVLKGFEIGADDYMRKPCNIEELIARMHRLLKKDGKPVVQAPQQRLTVGQYEYTPGTFELRHGDATVYLSPRAGELLSRMATATDRLLPRKETLIDLWGDDTFFNGRSLDVFISKLRKQLAADDRIRIVNIRGQGYKLVIAG